MPQAKRPRLVFTLIALSLAAVPFAGVALAQEAPAGWIGVMIGGAVRGEGDDAAAPGGVRITAVVQGGPAERSGVRARDVILSIDGTPVGNARELIARIKAAGPDRWVELRVQRGDDTFERRVRLGARPQRTEGLQIREGWAGLDAIELPPRLREHFGAPEDSGVMISEVEPGSPAEAAGFELGDVVFLAGEEEVSGASVLRRAIATGGVGNTMEFVLMRDGVEITLETVIEARPRAARRN